MVAKAQFEVASKTKMIDWTIERFKESNKDKEVPSSLLEKRKEILSSLEKLGKNPFVRLLEKKEIIEQMLQEGQFKIENLEKKYEVKKNIFSLKEKKIIKNKIIYV